MKKTDVKERILPVVYHSAYVTPLPEGHRFPMPKFGCLYEILQEEGITSTATVAVPEPVSPEDLMMVHHPDYVDAFLSGTIDTAALRRIGLPWSAGLANRTVHAVGGTLLTARLALEHGLACNSAGGTHHAHPGFGSGFCIFNDLAVTAAMLLRENTVNSVLVIDLDVHQGDGTAAAFRDEPRVFTFSMHCQENFPFRKVMGDLDIPVPAGTGDEGYMDRLTEVLPDLLDSVAPDLVLYDAGVDVFAGDRLGRLELSLTGITRRDSYVIAQCRRRNIPVAGVIGGGYDRDVRALAHRHAILHRTAHSRITLPSDEAPAFVIQRDGTG